MYAFIMQYFIDMQVSVVMHSADHYMQVSGCIRGIGFHPNTFLVPFLFSAMISFKSFNMKMIDWKSYKADRMHFLLCCIVYEETFKEKSVAKSTHITHG